MINHKFIFTFQPKRKERPVLEFVITLDEQGSVITDAYTEPLKGSSEYQFAAFYLLWYKLPYVGLPDYSTINIVGVEWANSRWQKYSHRTVKVKN